MEIVVVTWWESLEAIHGFAGADIERAVVEDDAAALLIDFEECVQHFDLVLSDDM